MPLTGAQLLQMSQQDLDSLFESMHPGPIPDGQAKGTAVIASGTQFSPEIAEFIGYFA